jgi:hypothetical protein
MKHRRGLQSAVMVLGLAGLAVAVVRSVDDVRDEVLPSPPAVIAAGVLTLVAIVAGGRGWAALFDAHDRRWGRAEIAGTYYQSQLTKYLPAGGLVQAASQVSLAAATGRPLGHVALAFPVSALCTVAAGGTLGAGLAFADGVPGWIRALSLVGLAAPALLHRRVMAGAIRLARRVVRRIPEPDVLPGQASIVRGYGWALLNLGTYAVGFAVLVGSVTDGPGLAEVASAFALSWVIGFVVVPVPSGIGIREAALLVFVPGVEAGPLLAASLTQRLLSIGAELTCVIGNRIALRIRSARGDPEISSPAAATGH